MNGIVFDLDEQEYHAHPSLSSTGARRLLESPARFEYWRKHPQPGKTAFDLGSAVHAKVLGAGADTVPYPPEFLTPSGVVSSKAAAVAWAEEQRAGGLIPVGADQAARVAGMTEAVLAHPTARGLFEQPGGSEVSLFGEDPTSGTEMRCRFDFLPNGDAPNPVAVDLKTTGKHADALSFNRTVANLGYDVQDRFYMHLYELLMGVEVPFVFVVVETEAPYLVGVHQLDVVWRQMGADKVRRALDVFAECTASGVWPGYPVGVQQLSPPTYAVIQHEELYESEEISI